MTANEERLLNLALQPKAAYEDIIDARQAVLAERVDPKLIQQITPMTNQVIQLWNEWSEALKGMPHVLQEREVSRYYRETHQ